MCLWALRFGKSASLLREVDQSASLPAALLLPGTCPPTSSPHQNCSPKPIGWTKLWEEESFPVCVMSSADDRIGCGEMMWAFPVAQRRLHVFRPSPTSVSPQNETPAIPWELVLLREEARRSRRKRNLQQHKPRPSDGYSTLCHRSFGSWSDDAAEVGGKRLKRGKQQDTPVRCVRWPHLSSEKRVVEARGEITLDKKPASALWVPERTVTEALTDPVSERIVSSPVLEVMRSSVGGQLWAAVIEVRRRLSRLFWRQSNKKKKVFFMTFNSASQTGSFLNQSECRRKTRKAVWPNLGRRQLSNLFPP